MSKDIVRTSKTLYLHRLYNEILDDYCDTNNVFVYKIGETDYDNGGLRRVALGKNNSANLDTLIDSCSHECPLYHPTAIDKRFTDRCVINRIKETHGDIFRDPPRKVFKTLGITDGLTEIFTVDKKYSTEDVRKIVLQEYNYCKNNGPYIKNKETAEEQEINKLKNTYVVSQKLIDDSTLLYDVISNYSSGTKILMIRQFSNSFVTELLTRGFIVYNLIDNVKAQVEISTRFKNYILNTNITAGIIDKGEDMKKAINDLNSTFDIAIINPPYSCGSKIINSTLEVAKKVVALAPFNCYKLENQWQHVEDCQIVDETAFSSASIAKRALAVSVLSSKTNNNYTWDEFKAEFKTSPKYRHYYRLNAMSKINVDARCNMDVPISLESTFMISARAAEDGVHTTTNCFDYHYNVLRDISDDKLPLNNYKGNTQWGFTPYRLKDSKSKDNLTTFWYKNPLMNELLKNSGESSSSYAIALPRIDWSVDRDYEHLTLDDLINILKEENR